MEFLLSTTLKFVHSIAFIKLYISKDQSQ